MKERLLLFISVLFILFLTSNCSGIKPFYKVSNITEPKSPYASLIKPVIKSHNSTYGNSNYFPISEEAFHSKKNSSHDKKEWKLTVSFPADFKFEFNHF